MFPVRVISLRESNSSERTERLSKLLRFLFSHYMPISTSTSRGSFLFIIRFLPRFYAPFWHILYLSESQFVTCYIHRATCTGTQKGKTASRGIVHWHRSHDILFHTSTAPSMALDCKSLIFPSSCRDQGPGWILMQHQGRNLDLLRGF